ncbi:pyruvate dehydrogenase (acetyl-transferring), homodimeric type [candidate division KSB1 bacterium]|nr:MAG: pyruvate dehydrogenase (acetyl-transferring), homodimeric type [candidate division KSB1 bacterium]
MSDPIDPLTTRSTVNDVELREWLDSFDYVIRHGGHRRAAEILRRLRSFGREKGVPLVMTLNTPYLNTIPLAEQPPFPGNRDIERRIKSLIRWNAMATVVRANRRDGTIGGHIATYASAATLYEVGFNHFFRGKDHPSGGDLIFFQGHASPGVYARAFLEGRLNERDLDHFRHELAPGGGLSSYPHPRLMPDFWEFPTVSMGLGPIMAIYQARFNRYLQDRGLQNDTGKRVWCFLGDGETDEPESLGAISLAGREKLDNLTFVVNCNLQRLDGPVRGNGKIIQELEAVFRGAGWNVIKVIWGNDWDLLLAADDDGALVQRMTSAVDGDYQKYSVESGSYARDHFFGTDPRLLKMVEHLSDEQLQRLRRGGHDPEKVFAAFKAATGYTGGPTVILAKTIKGYGMGESGEGRNITHQQKKLTEDALIEFASRFDLPLSHEQIHEASYYRPPENSPEIKYLRERRAELGGSIPRRIVSCPALPAPDKDFIGEFASGTEGREVSTTMVFVRILAKLLRESHLGKFIVPIVPDEARTFGLEALFRQIGIYSHVGQLYEPVDRENLLYYREAREGQILEEGITEAGSMSSFIAAGTGYVNHGVPAIPFWIFYSQFGLQRVGDLVWAAGDIQTRGFLMAATAGRTTLAGEGLQHQDGHSHLLAYPVPNLVAYDPAYAYELAVIIRDGLRRMYENGENVFYYITVMNENYAQPPMPEGVEEGILRGIYCFRSVENPRVHLLGGGAILNEVVKAQALLAEKYGVEADIFSVTSYKELHRDALACERWNMLHPSEPPREPYLSQVFADSKQPFVAASDYVKALPESVSAWLPGSLLSLGTDGFGRSDSRAALRDFFEVDDRHIAYAALYQLFRAGELSADVLLKAQKELEIDPEKPEPVLS